MIDIHTHILPGFDDGAPDMDASIAMARRAAADGVRTVVATPHVITGAFRAEPEEVAGAARRLNEILVAEGIPLTVLPGAEYYLEPDLAARWREGRVIPLGGEGNAILIELPAVVVPDQCLGVIYELQLAGVTPLIAHPERNETLLSNPGLVKALAERGCPMQVTAASVTGAFGRQVRRFALSLITSGAACILASDAHSAHGARNPELSRAVAEVASAAGRAAALRTVTDGPALLLGIAAGVGTTPARDEGKAISLLPGSQALAEAAASRDEESGLTASINNKRQNKRIFWHIFSRKNNHWGE